MPPGDAATDLDRTKLFVMAEQRARLYAPLPAIGSGSAALYGFCAGDGILIVFGALSGVDPFRFTWSSLVTIMAATIIPAGIALSIESRHRAAVLRELALLELEQKRNEVPTTSHGA